MVGLIAAWFVFTLRHQFQKLLASSSIYSLMLSIPIAAVHLSRTGCITIINQVGYIASVVSNRKYWVYGPACV